MIRVVAFLLIFAVAAGCSGPVKMAHERDDEFVSKVSRVAKTRGPNTPDWVQGKGHPRFPQSRYLVGVGFSEINWVSANASAQSNLAKTLKVKIRSKMVDVSTTEQQYVESVIETEVDTVLEGVEIKDGWEDQAKNVYYSLAILDRKLAAATIRSQIGEIESRLPKLISEGKKNEAAGDLIGALSHYFSGYRISPPLAPLKSAYRVITRSLDTPGTSSLGTGDFAFRIDDVVQNLTLSYFSGDKQVVKSIGELPEPLVVKVNFKGKPVQGIPVVFKFERGDGELEAKKVSNADGKTETSVHNILALHEKKHRISARFDYGQLASQFNSKPNEGFLDPLNSEKVLFHYFIKTPEWGSEKSFAWKKGITGMVNQIIRNISPGGNPKVGIVEFKDLRLNRILPFSRILEEDFKTILIQAENLTVKEVPEPEEDQTPYDLAQRAGVDFYISGSYRMERQGLEIRGQLTETSSGYIFSSAQVQIARNEIYPDDLNELIPSVSPGKLSKPADGYDANLEKLIFTRPSDSSFKIKVWTKKSDYRIGDTITFKVESEKDCYLTLLHIDSSGNANVIFPNKYRRNNFLKTGKVYIIPSPEYGFKINVEGPPGLERIIALATLTPGAPIDLNLEKGFYRIERGTNRGTRDIKIIADRFSTDKASTWAQAYTEVFIYEKEKVYFRGSRQIPLVSKPKKPKDMIGTFGSKLKVD